MQVRGNGLGDFYLVFLKLSCVMWMLESLDFGVGLWSMHLCFSTYCVQFSLLLNMARVASWNLGWGKMLNTFHWALSDTLFGPNNVDLWKTVWLCCGVWLFDYRSFLNRKKITFSLALESMLMVDTMFHAWEVQISNLLKWMKQK
jgi:hypothetical protein